MNFKLQKLRVPSSSDVKQKQQQDNLVGLRNNETNIANDPHVFPVAS